MELDFIKKLKERTEQGGLRSLKKADSSLIDFVSNDYLSLSRSQDLFERIANYSYDGITNLNGATGSRLLAGNSEITEQLEGKLAQLFQGEAALLFNSGYVANLALLSSLPQRQDTIIYDSLAHVCIKEGARLSPAKTFTFRHNDADDLEKKLKRAQGQAYVAIESVYSMDGDLAEFNSIIEVCKRYDAQLLVDEAHGTGLYGTGGNGKVCELGMASDFLARVYTFGKAMGVHGACIVGSKELIDYLINFARPFIYTTALPAHSIFSIDAAFDHILNQADIQTQNQALIHYFNRHFQEKIGESQDCQKLESTTPIQPIIVPGNTRAKELSKKLQQEGFDVRPILSPTIPEGSERLRICIHNHNSESEIRDLIDSLSSQL